jgi:predicted small secreted protein
MLSGCNTVKGAADGASYTVNGVADGVAKDAQATGTGIMALDAWIKKNAW